MGKRKSKRANLINLDAVIGELLADYGDLVYDTLADAVEDVTQDATKKLHEVDTFRTSGHAYGPYSGDWMNEAETYSRIHQKRVVYNDTHYRLTHLLENGHVIRNGTGRTYGRTGKYPHIDTVQDWAVEELRNRIKRKIE